MMKMEDVARMAPTWAMALAALLVGFGVTVAIGPALITYLRKMKFGQKILEIGPKWHMNKQNIPTMGGFMFMIGITVAVLAVNAVFGVFGAGSVTVLCMALAYGAVGFVDDHAKIKKKENAGLSPLQKLVLQVIVAAVFIWVLRTIGVITPHLYVPFFGGDLIGIPWAVFVVFAAFVIVGTVNAVNLTDGLDGLAASVTLPVALFFAATGWRQGDAHILIFSLALAGALGAFLIFNFNPAKVFMGDTGSLFLGGAVAGLAFACDMPLVLIPVGAFYIWETLSDIIQVGYFKLTHGKRVFKMAPFHHHLEMCGWSERKIVITFAAVTAVLCLLTYCFG